MEPGALSVAVAPPPRTSRTRLALRLLRGSASSRVKAVPSPSSTPRPREQLGRSKRTRAGWVWSLRLRCAPSWGWGQGEGGVQDAPWRRPRCSELSEAGDGELQAPPAPGRAHTGVSHVHTSLFFSLSLLSTRRVSFLRAEPSSPVNLSGLPGFWFQHSADLGKYRVECKCSFLPPEALSFVYTWEPGSNSCTCCPCRDGDSFPVYIWRVSPYVQNGFFPREVQVSAGEAMYPLCFLTDDFKSSPWF